MPRLNDLFIPDVILIDAMNLSKRYHHALQLTDCAGVPMGAPYGIIKFVHKLRTRYRAAEILFLWEGRTSFRKVLYPAYKARRQKSSDDLFYISVRVLKSALSYMGITQVYYPGMEADDLAGYYCRKYAASSVLLVSNDYDWFQYLTNNRRLQMSNKMYSVRSAVAKLGFPPIRIPVYKALTGDVSDNIIGIVRFPRKLAVHLCNGISRLSDLKRRPYYGDIMSAKVLNKWHAQVCAQWEHIRFVYSLVCYNPKYIKGANVRAIKACASLTSLKALLLRHGMNAVNILGG